MKSPIDNEAVLKQLAAEAARQGQNVRAGVRQLMLLALQTRDLSLPQIKQALRSVTEGVSVGVASGKKVNTEKVLSDAFAGMDDALLKAVEASQVALNQVVRVGEDFKDSPAQKALHDLERMEDEFLKTVKQASGQANDQVKAQWGTLLKTMKLEGTETGSYVETAVEQVEAQMRRAMREHRDATLKVAHMLGQNFATIASGVLIGMSESLKKPGTASAGAKKKKRAK